MADFDPTTHVHSVKEVDLMRTCPRKHSAKYLHQLDDPKHANAADGIAMHNLLERMLQLGPQANADPESRIGKWARALYPHAPPQARTEVGQNFEMFGRRASFRLDWCTHDFTGFGDWKSTSGVQWALAGPDATPDAQQAALSGDLQANWENYGVCKTSRKSFQDLTWCYVDKKSTGSPKTWTVKGRLSMQYSEHWLRQHALPHIEMIEILRSVQPMPDVQAVPHEITACRGQGNNCAFLGSCQFQDAPVTVERLYRLARPNPVV